MATDPLEKFTVSTNDAVTVDLDEPPGPYICICGYETLSKLDFQQHLTIGQPHAPRDLNIHVTDSIGMEDHFG